MHLIFYLNPHHRFHVIQPVDFNLLCLFSSPPTRKWQPNRSILHLSSPLYSAKWQRPSCIRSFLFKSTSPVPCHPTRRLQSTLPLLPPLLRASSSRIVRFFVFHLPSIVPNQCHYAFPPTTTYRLISWTQRLLPCHPI
jgi:hypothetical protein